MNAMAATQDGSRAMSELSTLSLQAIVNMLDMAMQVQEIDGKAIVFEAGAKERLLEAKQELEKLRLHLKPETVAQ